MICYKDMTFCEFKDCKHFDNGCHRSLTEKVKQQAIRFGLPICQFTDKPDCHEYKDKFNQNGDASAEPDYKIGSQNNDLRYHLMWKSKTKGLE